MFMSPSFAMFIVLALLFAFSNVQAADYCSYIGDGGFECSKYIPRDCYNHKCIPERMRQPEKFEQKCKERFCFLLKQEAPIIVIPQEREKRNNISVPFPCNESSYMGIRGKLTNLFMHPPAGDHFCVWVGDHSECTWNMIQHLVAFDPDYKFVAAGPMLETPQRKCHHVPSSSWLDDKMVVIGNSSLTPDEKPWLVITRPFSRMAWGFFVAILCLHVIVFLILASLITWKNTLKHKLAATYFFLTGDEGNVLESKFFNDEMPVERQESALKSEPVNQQPSPEESKKEEEEEEIRSWLTALASMFRLPLKMTFLVFLIFYEAGLVNLLFFQENLSVPKRTVGAIPRGKLPRYCVMKDSALANVWRNKVDPRNESGGAEGLIWREEDSLLSCIHRIIDKNDEVRFAVSYEIEAKFQIDEFNKNPSDRNTRLTVFDFEDDIYRFNSGWLFKKPEHESESERQDITDINIQIVQKRVNGSMEDWLGGNEEPEKGNKISVEVLAIACTPFVVLPLFIMSVLLYLWGRLHVSWSWNFWCLSHKPGQNRKAQSDEPGKNGQMRNV